MQYCQRIFQLLFGTSCPFMTGERVMKRDGEQVSEVDIVRTRKVRRMGDREGGAQQGLSVVASRWLGGGKAKAQGREIR